LTGIANIRLTTAYSVLFLAPEDLPENKQRGR